VRRDTNTMMPRKKQDDVRKPVFIGIFAGLVFCEWPSRQHKKAGRGFRKKNLTRPSQQIKLWNRRRAAWSNKRMNNLVNGVVPRLAVTDATNVKDGACGTKLLIGLQRTPLAGRSTASLPVRGQLTSPHRPLQDRMFLLRKGSPAGDWRAPDKLETQALDAQQSCQIQLFTSLLRLGGGWRANHALRRTRPSPPGCNRCVPCAGSLSLSR
jgi:hypothetical protein